MKAAITSIEMVLIQIILIVEETFTIEISSEYTCDDFFAIVLEFLTLLVRGEFGEALEAATSNVLAVFSLSSVCSSVTISYFESVLIALNEINVNVINTVTVITQTLIISRGLIVTIKLEDLYLETFNKQVETFDTSLGELREGCRMADEVANDLEEFLEIATCRLDANASKDIGNLIQKITELTKIMAFDIENKNISLVAIETQDLISKI